MIIGINGFKNAGKNTVGSYLVEYYGFEETSFAAPLKKSAAALFSIPPFKWEDLKNDPNVAVSIHSIDGSGWSFASVSAREFLQRYGTEAHRDIFGEDFWVEYAMKGINASDNIVFTDARLENELQRIKSLGGYNLQVLRPELFTQDSHVSEVPPPQHLIDYAVDNSGGFIDLYRQVDDFMEFVRADALVQ